MRISNFIVILLVTILTIVFIFDHYVIGQQETSLSATPWSVMDSKALMKA